MEAMYATANTAVLPHEKLSVSRFRCSNRNSTKACRQSKSLISGSCLSAEGLGHLDESSFQACQLSDKINGFLAGSYTYGPSPQRNPLGQSFYSAGVCTFGENALESPSLAANENVGVLLLNLGGPETLYDVQPFLFNLFADPVCHLILNDTQYS